MLKNKSQTVGVLFCGDYQDVRNQLQSIDPRVDVVEWRIDALHSIDIKAIKLVCDRAKIPMILTLRRKEQGGLFEGELDAYITILKNLISVQPAFIDIEYIISKEMLNQLSINAHKTKFIYSWHQMGPDYDLAKTLKEMRHPSVTTYKLITKSDNTVDMLKMAHFIKEQSAHVSLTGHVMGALSTASRVLGAVVGNRFVFGVLQRNGAIHIPLLSDLLDIYHVNHVNPQTKIFGLIGSPVEHSVGHLFHNAAYRDAGHNAVYIKMPVVTAALSEFFSLLPTLPFYGLSVTMPLKAAVIPYMDKVSSFAAVVSAVNTIKIDNGRYDGVNTDGYGCIKALKGVCEVKGAYILIIGAGGAASAIAQALYDAGAYISIANRNSEHAKDLAEKVNANAYSLTNVLNRPSGYDVIINAIPIEEHNIKIIFDVMINQLGPSTVLFNIDYAEASHLLDDSLKGYGKCHLSGKTLYEHQALGQLNTWFNLN